MADLPLTKVSETAKTVTIGWTPVPCRGYALYREGEAKPFSNSWDSGKSTWPGVKKADLPVRVVALGSAAEGIYPPLVPPVDPPPATGIQVSVQELQAAVNNSHGGEVFLVKPGTANYQLFLPNWANVQVRGLDPARPPLFVGGGLDGYYAIYSEGASTIGPDLTTTNPNGYGVGVRANGSDITGGRVTGVLMLKNGITGLYQGTQPGRTHTGFKVDNCVGRENGQRLDLDPHQIKGDGEHTVYIGGGEGVTG